MQMIFYYWKQLLRSLRQFFLPTDFFFFLITSCSCTPSFHAFPGGSHAIYLAPGNSGKHHRLISLWSLSSYLAAN